MRSSKTAILKTAAAVLVAAVTAAASSPASAADAKMKEVLDRGVVRVGVLGAFKPWSFRAPDGSMQGIEIDLAQSVADALGVKLQPVVVTSANRMQSLQQEKSTSS